MLCGGNEIFCGLFIHRTSMLQKVIVPSLFPDVKHYSIVNKTLITILIVVIIVIMDCRGEAWAPRKTSKQATAFWLL